MIDELNDDKHSVRPNSGNIFVSGSSVYPPLQLMHFKYGCHNDDFTEEEMDEFRKNEDNYYLYSHFMLKDYRGHTLHKLGVFDQSEEDINRKQVIEYYVDDDVKCSSELHFHLPFQVGVKYEIGELIKLLLS